MAVGRAGSEVGVVAFSTNAYELGNAADWSDHWEVPYGYVVQALRWDPDSPDLTPKLGPQTYVRPIRSEPTQVGEPGTPRDWTIYAIVSLGPTEGGESRFVISLWDGDQVYDPNAPGPVSAHVYSVSSTLELTLLEEMRTLRPDHLRAPAATWGLDGDPAGDDRFLLAPENQA